MLDIRQRQRVMRQRAAKIPVSGQQHSRRGEHNFATPAFQAETQPLARTGPRPSAPDRLLDARWSGGRIDDDPAGTLEIEPLLARRRFRPPTARPEFTVRPE